MTHVLSASQISSWLLCKRRWFFASHVKLPQKEFESAKAGIRVHKILEDYLVHGTPIDRTERLFRDFNVGAVATALARDLPPAGSVPADRVESHFVIDMEGVKIQGYRDLIDLGFVRDHKTTSALKWAKSAEDLQTDPQAIIYAVSMGEDVTCEWGYGQIKGPAKTLLIRTKFTETQAFDKYYLHVHPHALEILKAKALPAEESAAQELEPNLNACEAFGGCSFKSQCRRPMKSLNGKKRLPMVMSKEEALAMLRSKRKGVNPDPLPPAESTVNVSVKTENVPVVPALPETQVEPVATIGSFDQVVANTDPGIPWDNTPSTNAQEIVDAEPPVEAKKRGRPKKSPEPEAGFVLYIGCQPVKASVTYLHDIIPSIAEEVEKVNAVAHWSLMDFGAGRGALAAAMKAYLKQTALNGALVVKFPHLPETQAVLSVLVNAAREIVVS